MHFFIKSILSQFSIRVVAISNNVEHCSVLVSSQVKNQTTRHYHVGSTICSGLLLSISIVLLLLHHFLICLWYNPDCHHVLKALLEALCVTMPQCTAVSQQLLSIPSTSSMHTQQMQKTNKNAIMHVGLNGLWKYMRALILQQKLNNYHVTEHTQMSLMKDHQGHHR